MSRSLCHLAGGTLIFRFRYDVDLIDAVKRVPTARWNPDERGWTVNEAATPEAVAFAELHGFEVFDEVHDAWNAREARGDAALRLAKERAAAVGEKIRPYQYEGIRDLGMNNIFLLGWGQRTGKTPISLLAAPEERPVLVVPPAGVAYQWGLEEGPHWRPDLTWDVREGRGNFRWPRRREAVVIPWSVLPPANRMRKWVQPLPGAWEETVLVVDEAHMGKNPEAKRTQSIRSLVLGVLEKGGYVWFLTASPLANSPMELWRLLETMSVAHLVFGSFNEFMALYGAKKYDGQILWKMPSPEARIRLGRVMSRVTMKDVRKDVEPFIHSFVPVQINLQTRRAKLWLRDFERWQDAVDHGQPSVVTDGLIATVRKEIAWAKTPAAIRLVETYEQADEPVVVFCAHYDPIAHIAKRKGWGKISGTESSRKKNEVKRAFQSGKLKGVACVIRAGALGITLNRAKEMIFIDLDHNPEQNAQAQMRCVAVDQDEPVRIRTLVAAGTPDEDQLRNIDYKVRMIRGTLEKPPPRRKKPPPRRRR